MKKIRRGFIFLLIVGLRMEGAGFDVTFLESQHTKSWGRILGSSSSLVQLNHRVRSQLKSKKKWKEDGQWKESILRKNFFPTMEDWHTCTFDITSRSYWGSGSWGRTPFLGFGWVSADVLCLKKSARSATCVSTELQLLGHYYTDN